MGRFEEGMKAGAKPFEDSARDAANEMRRAYENLRHDNDKIKENIYEIIDVIAEDDPLNRKEILENLKTRRESNLKPASYSINVVYTKAYENLADDIRMSLNQQGNTASMVSYDEYKKHNSYADYYILLGMKCGNTDENLEVLLSANGCHIDKYNNHIYVYTREISLVSDADWNQFSGYYKEVTNKALDNDKIAKEARKAQNGRNERNKIGDTILGTISGKIDRIMDAIDIETSTWNPVLALIVGVPAMLASFIVGTVSLLLALPTTISAIAIGEVVNQLDRRDTEYLEKAQMQILLIKICEFYKNQQITNAR